MACQFEFFKSNGKNDHLMKNMTIENVRTNQCFKNERRLQLKLMQESIQQRSRTPKGDDFKMKSEYLQRKLRMQLPNRNIIHQSNNHHESLQEEVFERTEACSSQEQSTSKDVDPAEFSLDLKFANDTHYANSHRQQEPRHQEQKQRSPLEDQPLTKRRSTEAATQRRKKPDHLISKKMKKVKCVGESDERRLHQRPDSLTGPDAVLRKGCNEQRYQTQKSLNRKEKERSRSRVSETHLKNEVGRATPHQKTRHPKGERGRQQVFQPFQISSEVLSQKRESPKIDHYEKRDHIAEELQERYDLYKQRYARQQQLLKYIYLQRFGNNFPVAGPVFCAENHNTGHVAFPACMILNQQRLPHTSQPTTTLMDGGNFTPNTTDAVDGATAQLAPNVTSWSPHLPRHMECPSNQCTGSQDVGVTECRPMSPENLIGAKQRTRSSRIKSNIKPPLPSLRPKSSTNQKPEQLRVTRTQKRPRSVSPSVFKPTKTFNSRIQSQCLGIDKVSHEEFVFGRTINNDIPCRSRKRAVNVMQTDKSTIKNTKTRSRRCSSARGEYSKSRENSNRNVVSLCRRKRSSSPYIEDPEAPPLDTASHRRAESSRAKSKGCRLTPRSRSVVPKRRTPSVSSFSVLRKENQKEKGRRLKNHESKTVPELPVQPKVNCRRRKVSARSPSRNAPSNSSRTRIRTPTGPTCAPKPDSFGAWPKGSPDQDNLETLADSITGNSQLCPLSFGYCWKLTEHGIPLTRDLIYSHQTWPKDKQFRDTMFELYDLSYPLQKVAGKKRRQETTVVSRSTSMPIIGLKKIVVDRLVSQMGVIEYIPQQAVLNPGTRQGKAEDVESLSQFTSTPDTGMFNNQRGCIIHDVTECRRVDGSSIDDIRNAASLPSMGLRSHLLIANGSKRDGMAAQDPGLQGQSRGDIDTASVACSSEKSTLPNRNPCVHRGLGKTTASAESWIQRRDRAMSRLVSPATSVVSSPDMLSLTKRAGQLWSRQARVTLDGAAGEGEDNSSELSERTRLERRGAIRLNVTPARQDQLVDCPHSPGHPHHHQPHNFFRRKQHERRPISSGPRQASRLARTHLNSLCLERSPGARGFRTRIFVLCAALLIISLAFAATVMTDVLTSLNAVSVIGAYY